MSIAEKFEIIADEVYEVGYEQGKQDQYDTFWDNYQENGNRGNYQCAFAGKGWNAETFKPKYNIVPTTNASHMFREALEDIDLVEYLSKLGVTLDFSQCTRFIEAFYYVRFKRIGVVDTRSATDLTNIFAYPTNKFETIDLLKLKDDGTQTFGANSFRNATGLKNITIEGVIGSNFDIRYSPLTKASIESIVSRLSATASGKTVTFSKSAVNSAFTTDEWTNLIQPYSNWTISFI